MSVGLRMALTGLLFGFSIGAAAFSTNSTTNSIIFAAQRGLAFVIWVDAFVTRLRKLG